MLTQIFLNLRYRLKSLFAPYQRIRELEAELDDLNVLTKSGYKANGEEINMHFQGPSARMLIGVLTDFFYRNGGENFLATELHIRFQDPWWKTKKREPANFSLVIQRVDAGDSPAKKIERLEKELAAYKNAK